MKRIRRILLKEVRPLSTEEMKHVFGGSSVTQNGSGCFLRCGDITIFSEDLPGCSVCASSGGKMFCKSSPSSTGYPVTCSDADNA